MHYNNCNFTLMKKNSNVKSKTSCEKSYAKKNAKKALNLIKIQKSLYEFRINFIENMTTFSILS